MRSISGIFNRELATFVGAHFDAGRSTLAANTRRENPYEALGNLLASLFDLSTLHRFLALEPHGKTIMPALGTPPGTIDSVIFEALAALRHHGLINARFFARLLSVRPSEGRAIARVWRLWKKTVQE